MKLRKCLKWHRAGLVLLLCSAALGITTANGDLLPIPADLAAARSCGRPVPPVSAREAIESLLLPAPLTEISSLQLGADITTLSFAVPPADLRALHLYLRQGESGADLRTEGGHRTGPPAAGAHAVTPLLAAGWLLLPVLGALSLRGQSANVRDDG
jgi:hypothetical protein